MGCSVSRGFLIKTMFKIFVIFAACVVVSFSFSCEPCKKSTCQRPSYCKSGAYVKDPCQCCDECARAKNEECGGPWDTYGRCAPGLTYQASNSGNNFQTFDGYSDNPGKCIREGRNLNHSHSKDHQIHFGNFGLTSLGFRIPKA